MRSLLLCALAAHMAWHTATLGAQRPPTYTRGPDTLRFHELTTSEIAVETPKGPVQVGADHDAVVAVTFGKDATASAWYDSLAIGVRSPTGNMRPETGDALHQAFTLRFDARGRVRTVATPEFPESLRGVADLRLQFDDFFLRLPAQTLRIGLTWTDTVESTHGATTARRTTSRRIIRYEVLRDTTVNSIAALVIGTRQALRIVASQPVDHQPLTAHSAFAGNDEGIFVFAPALGRLLGRRRSGAMTGEIRYTGGPQPLTLAQRMTYTSAIDARP